MLNTKLRKRVATRCAKKMRKSEGKMFTRKVRKRVSRQNATKKCVNLSYTEVLKLSRACKRG